MYQLRLFILILTIGISIEGFSQPIRFGSGIFGGVNLSQVDGDDMQGYDKAGISFGLKGIAYIFPKFEFHTELAYSQRGSQSKEFAQSNNRGRKMYLDYASINALFVVNDWFHPIKEYYRLQIHGGLSTGRLIRYAVTDFVTQDPRRNPLRELAAHFNSTDFSMILGANLKVVNNAGISFRYTRSMNKILDADLTQPYFEKKRIVSMKGYLVSFEIFYLF